MPPYDNPGFDASSLWPGGIPNFNQPTISSFGPPNGPNLVRPQFRNPEEQGPARMPIALPPLPGPNAPVAPGQAPPATPAPPPPPPMMSPSFGAGVPNATPKQALQSAAPQDSGGMTSIFPAAQNAALTRYLGASGGQTPGGALPAGMAMPQVGEPVYNGNNPLTLESYLRPSGGVSGATFGNGDIMATLGANAVARDNMLRQRNDMASIPGAIQAQNARLAGGLFAPGQARDIATYGLNPTLGLTGTAQQGANDATRQTNWNTSFNPDLGRLALGQAAGNLTPGQAAEGRAVFDRTIQGGLPTAGPATTPTAPGQPPAAVTETPPVTPNAVAPPPQNSALDQYFRSAAQSAGITIPDDNRRGGPPLGLPAAVTGSTANNAITNFVHSLQQSGQLTKDNIPEVMSYMTRVFGPQRVDPWFGTNFWAWDRSPHSQAVGMIQNLANQRGANVGANWLTQVVDALQP